MEYINEIQTFEKQFVFHCHKFLQLFDFYIHVELVELKYISMYNTSGDKIRIKTDTSEIGR